MKSTTGKLALSGLQWSLLALVGVVIGIVTGGLGLLALIPIVAVMVRRRRPPPFTWGPGTPLEDQMNMMGRLHHIRGEMPPAPVILEQCHRAVGKPPENLAAREAALYFYGR